MDLEIFGIIIRGIVREVILFMEQHPNNQMMIFHGNFANEIYNKVLEFSIEVGCNYFEFCLRHDIDFLGDGTYSYSKNVEYLMEELASFLVLESQTNSWVTGHIIARDKEAHVYRYHLNQESLRILLKYSNAMNSWCGPNLPEDLVIFQEDKPWLGFIGHEEQSFWFLNSKEKAKILALGLPLFDEEEFI
ncbi:hypothetical protein DVY91_12670 [Enterococcus faecalis]|nr:hypothetical protein CG806_03475 [Enterococcus faecalis ARO1/DG]TKL72227.1 hypothetical protein DVW13_01430 [Enterococcus faecalis]EEU87103.1 predicted protein [Enterococcus faecalis ARO1/DG]TKM53888.1 hypothetical protein DVW59_02480 [Enterococcus faecalis]TKM63444.1 hypothetical protein DVW57_03425 [Enterococcus faecalis]